MGAQIAAIDRHVAHFVDEFASADLLHGLHAGRERRSLRAGGDAVAALQLYFDSFADADLVIEAATEDRGIKLDLFRRLDEITRPDVVLASNTSSIPIADLGTATKRPELVIGLHFFNPVPVMGLVEIVKAITTSDETVELARSYCVTLGKTTVLSRDRAGFIVNTLLIPYLNDAIRMLEEGFATREDVDTAIHLGLNHPMGPLRLADLIGLDTCLQIAEVLYDEFREPRFAPPPLLRRMVTAGRLGRKTGRGFYDYD